MKSHIKENEKTKKVYTKRKIISDISNNYGISLFLVRSVYDSIEKSIMDMLEKTNENKDIVIKLFDGITINSKFIPQKEKINNITGKNIITKSKIKPKASISRRFCDKLNKEK